MYCIKFFKESNCSRYPEISSIKFNNLYWQVLTTKRVPFYFYEAFLDVREKQSKGSLVRIIGMVKKGEYKSFHCHLWFNSSDTIHVEGQTIDFVYLYSKKVKHKWREDQLWPFMLTCKIPKDFTNQVPDSVSISQKRCDKLSNNLRYFQCHLLRFHQKIFIVYML